MTLYHKTDAGQLYQGDCIERMRERADEKRRAAWLIDSAVQEATNRGDWFNAKVFGGENPENLPRASIEAMQEYLFGTQPDVVKGFLKPLCALKEINE